MTLVERLQAMRQDPRELQRLRDRCGELQHERDALQAERDRLAAERDASNAECDALRHACGIAPPGHACSPLIHREEWRRDEARLFAEPPHALAAIDLREDEQLQLLEQFARLYPDIPFLPRRGPGQRYQYDNEAYSYSDAIFLNCMIRHARPRRLVQVGSGWSSCATLDTNERYFGSLIQTTFIDPHPELLLSLTSEADHARMRVLRERLQDVALSEFTALDAGDILFIDSTHVSKLGSDVNRLFFEILPALATGVYVHLHDIFFPFEYPKAWIEEGRSWNEAYLLRAFLQYNGAFRVVLMNTFVERFHEAWFAEHMPLCLANRGGSLWLQKVAA
jgi:Methyltransferase domain